MPAFKDEHVLIIAPGSQTTHAQLGLPETFTPPRWRFPTRMFPGLKKGEWEPVKIHTKTVTSTAATTTKHTTEPSQIQTNGDTNGSAVSLPSAPGAPAEDVQMADAPTTTTTTTTEAEPTTTVQDEEAPAENAEPTTTEEHYEDDPLDDTDAVYPMVAGRVENWPCFFAVLSHIYKFISPPFHMPVMVVSQPCWTARDKEWITQYFFENWKIPALCLMDAAVAAIYAYGVPTATIVDVGADKADVTAVCEFVINEMGRGVRLEGCGGNAMTMSLKGVLSKGGIKGVTWEMAEQLKKSSACEILPPGTPMPTAKGQPVNHVENPAAAASTGATNSGVNARDADGQRPGQGPRGPGVGTEVGEEGGDEDDNEGVLDVAAIVARDNAAELVAKREREKAERAAVKKGAAVTDNKQVRLKNSERARATFVFEEYLPEGEQPGNRKRKREIEVGTERFMATAPILNESDGILDKLAAAVHSTILAVPEVPARAALWENLIVLGNGSRVRGFTNALIATLNSRYTLSPSTATIFTSELPSNFSTPVPTNGTNTPIPGQQPHHIHPAGHGVNPLLVAATKNMMQPGNAQHLTIPGQPPQPMPGMDPAFHSSFRGHTQTPTSLKTVKAPDYFPEWKDPSVSGMEEAAFLGAQVAAKLNFIVDGGVSKGFLTRPDYNELGPEGIHTCAM